MKLVHPGLHLVLQEPTCLLLQELESWGGGQGFVHDNEM
jgi:hypothetical protein